LRSKTAIASLPERRRSLHRRADRDCSLSDPRAGAFQRPSLAAGFLFLFFSSRLAGERHPGPAVTVERAGNWFSAGAAGLVLWLLAKGPNASSASNRQEADCRVGWKRRWFIVGSTVALSRLRPGGISPVPSPDGMSSSGLSPLLTWSPDFNKGPITTIRIRPWVSRTKNVFSSRLWADRRDQSCYTALEDAALQPAPDAVPYSERRRRDRVHPLTRDRPVRRAPGENVPCRTAVLRADPGRPLRRPFAGRGAG